MSARTTRYSRALALTFALAVATGLSACGTDDRSSEGAPAAERTAANGDVHNDADVEFATEMIPHHADALVMVDMTQGRDLSPDFAALAEEVLATQAPEIETMADWLSAWGEEVPETSRDHVNSHDMGGMDDGTGMDPDDMAALEDADGAAFEQTWLRMMIAHHEGAIEMAQVEQRDGTFEDAVELAESIESGQAEEIAAMEDMLGE
ncbi:DUF305 domain-containing protein [Nocardioides KLBMP 9356]|uniref:DUF305 domain-containing protein n=1 Tax=Nocardioides potassii TaxID=2911371 RepID=A0ABS9HIK1_9ACTN|nr:DUF305 domain-containing protein [Nocardioides potassii]MCF6379928.1 DUF305 domain-containing protein [Nocardioides potassii]